MRKQNYRKKVSRRPRSKKGVVRSALAKSWKKSVARVVKKTLSSHVEVKSASYVSTVTPVNTLAGSSSMIGTNVIPVSPYWDSTIATDRFLRISQGTGEANRVGNVIRTKSCKGKIVIYPKPYNVANNPSDSNRPTLVTFWCVSPKNKFMSPSTAANRFDIGLFDNGNTVDGYRSQLLDLVQPINNDLFTLHFKRTYKLGHATYDNGIAGDGDQEFWTNNDYKMNHIINFDFTKFMPKRIVYQDGDDIPNCKTLYLFVGIAKADGSSYSSSSNYPVDMYLNLDFRYTDM